jgi:hypothetical protein
MYSIVFLSNGVRLRVLKISSRWIRIAGCDAVINFYSELNMIQAS